MLGQIVAVSALLALLLGCGSSPAFVWYTEVPQVEGPSRKVISPGDRILVQVDQHPELSGEFVVGASGQYSHPILGLVTVADTNPEQAAALITEKLGRFVQQPAVAVTLLAYRELDVTVIGEVRSPGGFQIAHGAGVLSALARAGGLTEFAAEGQIFVLRSDPAAKRIRFRYTDLTKPDPAAAAFKLQDGDVVLVE